MSLSVKKKKNFRDWHISLDVEDMTLRQAYDDQMSYGDGQADIPFIVRLFEHPSSPIAFDGAIGLKEHDYIHSILGRGMMNKDEAFVIGFTMGSSRDLNKFEKFLFTVISDHVYPKYYNWTEDDVDVFELGVIAGERLCSVPMYKVNYEMLLDKPLKEIRHMLSIDLEALRSFYMLEKKLFPDCCEPQRNV